MLVKVGEKITERLNIIPEKIYVEQHIYPVYACRVCEGCFFAIGFPKMG